MPMKPPKPRYRITIHDRQANQTIAYEARGMLLQQLSRILVGTYQGEDLVLTCRYVKRTDKMQLAPTTLMGRTARAVEVTHG